MFYLIGFGSLKKFFTFNLNATMIAARIINKCKIQFFKVLFSLALNPNDCLYICEDIGFFVLIRVNLSKKYPKINNKCLRPKQKTIFYHLDLYIFM